MKPEIYAEAVLKLDAVARMLGDDVFKAPIEDLARRMATAAQSEVDMYFEAAGLAWCRAPIRCAVCAGGHRYHCWDPPAFTHEAAYGWRLPMPIELKRLYEENPECKVFEPIGRLTSKGVEGLGHITALWTCDTDSRDFAIEATVTKEFGLSCHPAPKSGLKAVWLVHSV